MLHPRKDYNERIQDNANLIPKDEPVFLLRGQDALAPGILREYANRLREALELENNDNRSVVIAVSEHADAMEEYQRVNNKCKLADMPFNNSIYDNIDDVGDVEFENTEDEDNGIENTD
jgi:hypothetical protein